MKGSILTMALLSSFITNAQLQGVIKDHEDRPMPAATIVVYKLADSGLVKTAITNNDGLYSIPILKPGNYFIKASSIGFKDGFTSSFQFAGEAMQLPSMMMQKKESNMSNVVIKTQRPVIEVKADKMIFNIESNAAATGLDGMELLRQAPGVLVDHEDNIT